MDHNSLFDFKTIFILIGALIFSNLDSVKEIFQILALSASIAYSCIQAGIALKNYKNKKKD
jgi:hypothetical protein